MTSRPLWIDTERQEDFSQARALKQAELDRKAKRARELYAEGFSKTAIARRLHVDDGFVRAVLKGVER